MRIFALHTGALDRLTIQWDVFNLANLINRDWGHIRTGGFAGAQILNLEYDGLEDPAGSLINGGTRPQFIWTDTEAFNSQNILSNYRMQLSIRYAF